MNKFDKILLEFELRSKTPFPSNVKNWDEVPQQPINIQNSPQNNVVNRVTTDISEPDTSVSLPQPWGPDEAADFFNSLNGGNMLGALSILIGDPSLEYILDEEQMKNQLEIPLDNMVNSINQMGNAVLNKENDTQFSINNFTLSNPLSSVTTTPATSAIATGTTDITPENPTDENNIVPQLSNVIGQAKIVSEKIKGLFSEQNLLKVLSNFNEITSETGKLKNLKPIFDEWGKKATDSPWREELKSLASSISDETPKSPSVSTEKFVNIINDFINLNQLNEIAPVAIAGVGSMILLAMTKYFLVSSAASVLNIFGFIVARGITMPLRIFMVIIEKFKKYKNFLLNIFMPVQIVSGVIIKSGGQAGQFTGPMMQEMLQKITDFAIEIVTDIFKLLGLDRLVSDAVNTGKGWTSVITRTAKHMFTPSKVLKGAI